MMHGELRALMASTYNPGYGTGVSLFFGSARLLLFHSLAHVHSFMDRNSEEPMSWYSHSTALAAAVDSPFAHHTLVTYKQNFCSGSFIGSRIVLTVASCFQHENPPYIIIVKFAANNFMQEGQLVAVAEKKEHEYFQYKSKLDNDIALLVLEKHVMLNTAVKKVVLSKPDFVLPIYSTIVATGWRKDISPSQTHFLLQSEMTVIHPLECIYTYPDVLTDSIFCAKFEVKNLLSDNGGAALYKGMVVGILSYGANVEEAPHIALFTNVTHFYKWIKLNTERLLTKHCLREEALSAEYNNRIYN